MKVYRAAIEPILLYGLVILETPTPIVQKRLLAIEFTAIRIAYKLDRNATIAECLATHQGESISNAEGRTLLSRTQTTLPSEIRSLLKPIKADTSESGKTMLTNTVSGTGNVYSTHIVT